MSTETRILKERLLELIDQGRLTDSPLSLDGEPLKPSPEYRPDGYSLEPHKGCRRSRVVDERLAELAASSDPVHQRVAEEFPRWFCFDPREGYYPEMEAEEGSEVAREAFANAMIRTYWMLSGHDRIVPADFVTGPNSAREFHPECRVVLSDRDDLPAEWPGQALKNIDSAIDRIKHQIKFD